MSNKQENHSLRGQHWREFMEEVLGIPPDTPLSDVLPQVILKAAKPHYIPILSQATRDAYDLANTTRTPVPAIAPQPQPARLRVPNISPEFLRSDIDRAIVKVNAPSNLIKYVRFTGQQGFTGSRNFRMDFSHWTFGVHDYRDALSPSMASSTPYMLETLFRGIYYVECVGVQIMNYNPPFIARIT
jgi:hypothetical protein